MYNNTGERIRSRASVACVVKIFFNVVLGLFFFVSFSYFAGLTGNEWPEWAPMWLPVAFLFFAIYFALVRSIGAWNQYLLLAGYGELIEETTKSAAQLEEIKEILKTIAEKDTVSPDPVVELKENTDLD